MARNSRKNSRRKNPIEKLDATAREVCRLFQDGYSSAVPALLKDLKKDEIAFVVAFATDRLAEGTRAEFVKFFEQVVSE